MLASQSIVIVISNVDKQQAQDLAKRWIPDGSQSATQYEAEIKQFTILLEFASSEERAKFLSENPQEENMTILPSPEQDLLDSYTGT